MGQRLVAHVLRIQDSRGSGSSPPLGICAFGGRTANHPHLFRTHTNTRTHTHTHTHTHTRISCFSCPCCCCCCCCQVWARVSVWKGVDGVLCGVQAHKCPKGGLEPLFIESPILGMRPANHYTMPAFENFTEGKETASCFSCPSCCCQVWARACVCGTVWMMFCAVFKRTNVQREGSNPCL